MQITGARSEVLAIIPARGGSKGVPRKNLRTIAGLPLVAHSIAHARAASSVTRTVVSTDDPEIAQVARRAGAEIIDRPANLSGDRASSESALAHVLAELKRREDYTPDLVVFLQATSPIRASTDIHRAVQLLSEQRADSLLSVCASHDFLWTADAAAGAQALNYDPVSRPRRQDMAPQYRENGSIYIFKPWVLDTFASRLGGRIALYEMDAFSSLQIDTEEDIALIEHVLASRTRTVAAA